MSNLLHFRSDVDLINALLYVRYRALGLLPVNPRLEHWLKTGVLVESIPINEEPKEKP